MGAIEFIAGLVLVLSTLWDAFETIVLPRTIRRLFRLTRMVYLGSWFVWSSIVRPRASFQEPLLGFFGPLFLIFLVVVWALGLVLGFALIQLGIGAEHLAGTTTTAGFGRALYFSGSTFFTL